ncbi:MAG: HK97 family phage prohead protease, partial [Gammaproteobacteria bacterium]|nr:HK97 family phage prohead protease [Gammaproteobacteria bacterium]
MDKFEKRSGQPVDVRSDDSGVTVAGYAAVFSQWADIGGWYEEMIAPGAFDGRLGDDVRFLINHEGLPLARVGSGTLKLSVDERGLKMETELDASDPDAQRVIPKLKRGDL